MSCFSFTNTTAATLLHGNNNFTTTSTTHHHHHHHHIKPPSSLPLIKASIAPQENDMTTNRRKLVTTLLSTSLALALNGHNTPVALAQSWGTRSFIWEHFFEPGLSPEDAAARIKQTADGLHSIRDMLEHMSWRYVLFYIRLKAAYLAQDLKSAVTTLPEGRKNDYIKAANELVDNMAELDYYVRTPKVYESYLYYEKTLKSIDNVVAILA